MSKTIQDYFDNAQLSQASYAILTRGMENDKIKKALRDEQQSSYSQTQASQFAQKYSIVHSQQNTVSGFSATVFKDTAGGYTFAIRGTEPSDFGPDVLSADFGDIGGDGIALKQAVDLFNYYQLLTTDTNSQAMQLEFHEEFTPPLEDIPYQKIATGSGQFSSPYIYRYLKVVDSVSGLGKIPPTAEINVTGHSLGGHLALILARLDPAHINQVYTYNAPGFNTFIGSNDTDWFFNTVNQLQQQEQGASGVSASGFPNEKIHNLVIPKDVISDIGHLPNGQLEQFGEAQNIGSAHSITGMVDSLAVYGLLSNLSTGLGFEDISPLLKTGANQAKSDLEGILNIVGDLLFLSAVPKAETGNRETFYKRLQAIATEIYIDVNALTPVLKPQYQSLQIVVANSLADSAKEDTADGFAYRYALKNLNPFAITGNVNLYSQHNQHGELNEERFSDQYLTDRAHMLEQLMIRNTANSIVVVGGTGKNESYLDLSGDGLHFATSDVAYFGPGLAPDSQQFIFGDERDNIDITGGTQGDHLYGGDGNDILHGHKGNDYIEGNRGDDILFGGDGSDTLIGGLGNDKLYGGASGRYADRLEGGQGNDHYYVSQDDGDTIIRDSDGQGRLFVDGKPLGDNIKAQANGGHVYEDADHNRYLLNDNSLAITLNSGQKMVIEDFRNGDLGLNFQTAETIVASTTSLDIAGDFEWLDFDPQQAGVQVHYDRLGNPVQDFNQPGIKKDILNGSAAADHILPGEDDDTVFAKGGDDRVEGGPGIDIIEGGDGDDQLYGDAGSDILKGGNGDDTLYANSFQTVAEAMAETSNAAIQGSLLSGERGNDLLIGNNGHDSLYGGAGADRLIGSGGDDNLVGDGVVTFVDRNWKVTREFTNEQAILHEQFGTTDAAAGDNGDTLLGGAGNDWLLGEWGDDLLDGGKGADLLFGGEGGDILLGGADDDRLFGDDSVSDNQQGNDILYGGEGDDKLWGFGKNDLLYGEAGSDELNGGRGDDLLFGGEGNDLLFGDQEGDPSAKQGNDRLDGGAGDDQLVGFGGDDFLKGGAGADRLFGENGDDRLYGGVGEDLLQGGDGLDFLYGEQGSDVLFGGQGDDILLGGTGDDELYGGEGNDWLESGEGNDRLTGGEGSDTFFVHTGNGLDMITDADGEDIIRFDDSLSVSDIKVFHATSLQGDYLFVIQYGQQEAIAILGGHENAIQRYEFADGSFTGRELIKQASDAPIHLTLSEPGIAQGGRFADTLIGSLGDDELYGEDGDDILAGAGGNDRLYGGAGHDAYRLGPGTGQDMIIEQANDASLLKLFPGVKLTDINYLRQGDDLLITLAGTTDQVNIQDFYRHNQHWRLETDQGDQQLINRATLAAVPTSNPTASVAALRNQYFQKVENFHRSLLSAFAYQPKADGRLHKEAPTGRFASRIDQYAVETTVIDINQATLLHTLSDKEETIIDTGRTETREFFKTSSSTGTYVDNSVVNSREPRYVNWDEKLTDEELEGYYQRSPEAGVDMKIDPLTGEKSPDLIGYWLFPVDQPVSVELTIFSQMKIPIIQHDIRYNLINYEGGAADETLNLAGHSFYAVEGGGGDDTLSAIHDQYGNLIDGDSFSRYAEPAVRWRNRITLPYGMPVNNSSAPGVFLSGGEGDDSLIGSDRNDILIGGAGSDHLEGGLGQDSYVFFAGDGQDVLFDDGWLDANSRQQDIVILPEAITLSDLDIGWGQHIQNSFYMGDGFEEKINMLHTSLELSWGNGQGLSIILPHSDQRAGYGVDIIQLADGARLSVEQVMALAGGSPETDPQRGDNTLQAQDSLYGGAGNDQLILNTIDISGGEATLSNGRGGEISLINPAVADYQGKLVGGEGQDQLTGSKNNDILIGGEMLMDLLTDFRRISGSYWSQGDIYHAGQGNDLLWTTAGDDIIEFELGDGQDWITDLFHDDAYFTNDRKTLALYWKNQDLGITQTTHQRQKATGQDRLRFGVGVNPNEIIVTRMDNHLVFAHANGTDRIVFQNWYAADRNQLNRVEFADGVVWDADFIAKAASNHAPTLTGALQDQTSDENSPFSYQLPADAFSDVDAGDSLIISVTLADGSPLPDWLTFDGDNPTLSGIAPLDASGAYIIDVTATDSFGLTAQTSFTLTINDINPEIIGSAANDILTGTNYDDIINSGDGDDALIGGAGNDTLIAGKGSDWLQGGQGDDTLVMSNDARWTNRYMAYNAGSPGKRGTGERVRITAKQRSHDLFDGGAGTDTLQGTDGDDALFLDDRFSPLPNGRGPRIKNIERFDMAEGDDIVDLTSQTYSLGDVELNGEAGDDILWGSTGNDILTGGQGNDRLSGGAGNDLYRFAVGQGHDQIRNDAPDHAASTDTLQFGPGITAGDLWFERIANDLKISLYQTGDDITVKQWYDNDRHKLDVIKLDDGQILINEQLDRLIATMAAFNAPSGPGAIVPTEVQQQLQPVLAASWG